MTEGASCFLDEALAAFVAFVAFVAFSVFSGFGAFTGAGFFAALGVATGVGFFKFLLGIVVFVTGFFDAPEVAVRSDVAFPIGFASGLRIFVDDAAFFVAGVAIFFAAAFLPAAFWGTVFLGLTFAFTGAFFATDFAGAFLDAAFTTAFFLLGAGFDDLVGVFFIGFLLAIMLRPRLVTR